jgi:predicted nucleic-acid-binding protein
VTNDKILDVLEAILSFPGLRVLDKETVIASISLARETDSSFADSYIVASANSVNADNVATFNRKHFTRLGTKLYPFAAAQ